MKRLPATAGICLLAAAALASAVVAALPSLAAPGAHHPRITGETTCGPPLHASGHMSLAYAGHHAEPRHLGIAEVVQWLAECNHDRFGWRAARYVTAGDWHAPMPAHMWYWLIEGSGGAP